MASLKDTACLRADNLICFLAELESGEFGEMEQDLLIELCKDELEFVKNWRKPDGSSISNHTYVNTITIYRNLIKEYLGPSYKRNEDLYRAAKRDRRRAIELIYNDPVELQAHFAKINAEPAIQALSDQLIPDGPSGVALTYLKQESELLQAHNTTTQANLEMRHENLRMLYIDRYISKINELFKSSSAMNLIIGLAAATGRRPAEIAFEGSFEVAGDSGKFKIPVLHRILFSGQLKSRCVKESYVIPCLLEADIVLEAFSRLREASKIKSSYLHGRFADLARTAFKGCIEFSDKGGQDKLRAAYAEIASKRFKPANISKAAYIKDILGHGSAGLSVSTNYESYSI